jgi:hypothetical protein
MSDTHSSIGKRFGWLSYPLLIFAASRCLLFAFAKAGPIFGTRIGSDPLLSRPFQGSYPTWASLAHGDIANYARIARSGYVALTDVPYFPLLPALGKWLSPILGSVELGLLMSSLGFCALGFVGVYRLFEELRGPAVARWGLALVAAFPLSYHLSDGSALGCLLAFPAWGIFLALRGRPLGAAIVLSLGVLAHPVCIFAAIATAWPPSIPQGQSSVASSSWLPRLYSLLPVAVFAGFMLFFASKFHSTPAGFRAALLLTTAKVLPAAWIAMTVVFGLLLGSGVLLLARLPGLRTFAVVGVAQLLCALIPGEATSAYALAACCPAFLAWGDLLARHEVLRGPALAMLSVHQGLLLYCFTHFVPLS